MAQAGALQNPLIGLAVIKKFEPYGYFSGCIIGAAGDTYRVRYSDGEQETMDRQHIIDILSPNCPCVFANYQLEGGASRNCPSAWLNKVPCQKNLYSSTINMFDTTRFLLDLKFSER